MKPRFSFSWLVVSFSLLSSLALADDLPLDSRGLIEKLADYEATELRDAQRRIEEKKQLVIETLLAQYKREIDAGNEAGALAIRSEVERIDGGNRRFTQGLDAMILDAGKAAESSGTNRIPTTATRIGSSYFQMFGDRVTRDEAKKRCESLGGRLAIIDSNRIYDKYINEVRNTYNFNACWTGAIFDKADQRWTWEGDETRFDERLLRDKSEIGNPQYEFLTMDITIGKLFSKPSDAKQCFLCEWKSEH